MMFSVCKSLFLLLLVSSDVAGLEVLFALVEMLSGLSLACSRLTTLLRLAWVGSIGPALKSVPTSSLFVTECVPNPVQAFSESSPIPSR